MGPSFVSVAVVNFVSSARCRERYGFCSAVSELMSRVATNYKLFSLLEFFGTFPAYFENKNLDFLRQSQFLYTSPQMCVLLSYVL